MIAEQLNCDAAGITAETSFKDDLGADSLDLFELVMACLLYTSQSGIYGNRRSTSDQGSSGCYGCGFKDCKYYLSLIHISVEVIRQYIETQGEKKN